MRKTLGCVPGPPLQGPAPVAAVCVLPRCRPSRRCAASIRLKRGHFRRASAANCYPGGNRVQGLAAIEHGGSLGVCLGLGDASSGSMLVHRQLQTQGVHQAWTRHLRSALTPASTGAPTTTAHCRRRSVLAVKSAARPSAGLSGRAARCQPVRELRCKLSVSDTEAQARHSPPSLPSGQNWGLHDWLKHFACVFIDGVMVSARTVAKIFASGRMAGNRCRLNQ